jgi:hypothetical protein
MPWGQALGQRALAKTCQVYASLKIHSGLQHPFACSVNTSCGPVTAATVVVALWTEAPHWLLRFFGIALLPRLKIYCTNAAKCR